MLFIGQLVIVHSEPYALTIFIQVDADAASKEEKEALLTKKMNLIRERNKAISERHKVGL